MSIGGTEMPTEYHISPSNDTLQSLAPEIPVIVSGDGSVDGIEVGAGVGEGPIGGGVGGDAPVLEPDPEQPAAKKDIAVAKKALANTVPRTIGFLPATVREFTAPTRAGTRAISCPNHRYARSN